MAVHSRSNAHVLIPRQDTERCWWEEAPKLCEGGRAAWDILDVCTEIGMQSYWSVHEAGERKSAVESLHGKPVWICPERLCRWQKENAGRLPR